MKKEAKMSGNVIFYLVFWDRWHKLDLFVVKKMLLLLLLLVYFCFFISSSSVLLCVHIYRSSCTHSTNNIRKDKTKQDMTTRWHYINCNWCDVHNTAHTHTQRFCWSFILTVVGCCSLSLPSTYNVYVIALHALIYIHFGLRQMAKTLQKQT